MVQTQTFESYPVFGGGATRIEPDQTKMANGYCPGEVYPAEWANWAWWHNSKGVSDLNVGVASMEAELNTLLSCAGETACSSCNTQVYDAMMHFIDAAKNTRAPTDHASNTTTYGVGTASNYGHLKISDTYTSVLSACSGVAASQMAVACVYEIANGKPNLGNTNGCALGTAAAGTATTAARSDHVHPIPTMVVCSCKVYRTMATASTERQLLLGEASETAGYGCVYVGNACKASFNPATGVLKATCFCGTASCAVNATCASKDGSGCSFGTAARYSCSCFRPSSWTPTLVDCAAYVQVVGTDKSMYFKWCGCTEQPAWVWGGCCCEEAIVYNPRCFTVKTADCASSATKADKVKNYGTGGEVYDLSMNWKPNYCTPTWIWGGESATEACVYYAGNLHSATTGGIRHYHLTNCSACGIFKNNGLIVNDTDNPVMYFQCQNKDVPYILPGHSWASIDNVEYYYIRLV